MVRPNPSQRTSNVRVANPAPGSQSGRLVRLIFIETLSLGLARPSPVIYLNCRSSCRGQVNSGRQFLYYYHDSPNPEEVSDPSSEMPIPKKGEIVERRRKKYEVKSVQPVVGKAIPTYIIQLMNTI
jgi:hypothetical protein